MSGLFPEVSGAWRVLLWVALAISAHIFVVIVRWVSRWLMTIGRDPHWGPKSRTIIGLGASVIIFALYFAALGLILTEVGVPIGAYLASTSIIGLAIAFGSQNLVQDLVMGLTVIFTDLFDVGDMIEVGGQVGIVERVGMRFTVLRNAMGAEVLVPNRTITNLIQYPRGYLRCYVDVALPDEPENAERVHAATVRRAEALLQTHPGIFRAPMEVVEPAAALMSHRRLRLKFRVWPGRGGPIEGAFRQELVQALKEIDPEYADWMVGVAYEIETR